MEAEFQKICGGILALMDKKPLPIGQKDCRKAINKRRPKRSSSDLKQVAEKRQTASQAKNDANLAKQRDMPKNTQHNVK